jgi:hypothetical protein
MLSTLQANKMEMMVCVKEGNEKLKKELERSAKEGNGKLKKELREEVRRDNAKLIEIMERQNFKLSQNSDEKLQKETTKMTKVIKDVKEGSEGEYVGMKRNMQTLSKELNDRHDYLASEKREEDVWLSDSMDDFVDELMEAELIQEAGFVEYVEGEMTHERVVSKVLTLCESNIDDFASELTIVENIKTLKINGGGDNNPNCSAVQKREISTIDTQDIVVFERNDDTDVGQYIFPKTAIDVEMPYPGDRSRKICELKKVIKRKASNCGLVCN